MEKYNIKELFLQASYFMKELLSLIDSGSFIGIDEIAERMEAGTVIKFVHSNCENQHLDITQEGLDMLERELEDIDCDSSVAHSRGVRKNGLIFLAGCIHEVVTRNANIYCIDRDIDIS